MTAIATKEKGVIFRPWEVQATLDRRKSQFRRPVKPQPEETINGEPYWHIGGFRLYTDAKNPIKSPYAVGQRLWVRESFKYHLDPILYCCIQYRQDKRLSKPKGLDYNTGMSFADKCEGDNPWRSSSTMPRWASRITLEVTEVRCERVRDISEEGAISEGGYPGDGEQNWHGDLKGTVARRKFKALYESHHGPGSFERDWVWVVGFDVLEVRG